MAKQVNRQTTGFLLQHKLLFGMLGAGLLIFIGVVGGIAILLSGAFNTAATTPHSRLTHRILETGLRYSVSSYAENIDVPLLRDEAMIKRGAVCFSTYCAQCHGAPGIAPHAYALGMMPVPSNLVQSARDWPPNQLYYVTKKGVRMTGMPAWEFRLSNEDLWSVVAFVHALPTLNRTEYLALTSEAPLHQCAGATDFDSAAEVSAKVLLLQYGCHSCHQIEGIVGPKSYAGPTLIDWPRRHYIAGTLPNTPENLVRWVVDPPRVVPQTLMPDLGVPEKHARIIADYLLAQE
jgi:mono/diheme cytochrome c family protein